MRLDYQYSFEKGPNSYGEFTHITYMHIFIYSRSHYGRESAERDIKVII